MISTVTRNCVDQHIYAEHLPSCCFETLYELLDLPHLHIPISARLPVLWGHGGHSVSWISVKFYLKRRTAKKGRSEKRRPKNKDTKWTLKVELLDVCSPSKSSSFFLKLESPKKFTVHGSTTSNKAYNSNKLFFNCETCVHWRFYDVTTSTSAWVRLRTQLRLDKTNHILFQLFPLFSFVGPFERLWGPKIWMFPTCLHFGGSNCEPWSS